jgi:transcriptional antiterminator RfaH
MQKWYVVYTRTNAEQQAAVNLGNQGFEVYLPRYRKTRRHARRIEEVLKPLFPRYLFVKIDLGAQAWHSVNGTRGVIQLVSFGDTPAAVPDAVIDELHAREIGDGSILLTHPNMKKGDPIQIVDGAMADVTGLFECMIDNDRALLLLNILGQTVRTSASIRSLSSAT